MLDVRLEAPAAAQQVRRMPADCKWMSSSSVGLPRNFSLPSVSLEMAQEKKRKMEDNQKIDEQDRSKLNVEKNVSNEDNEKETRESQSSENKANAKKEPSTTLPSKRKERSQEEAGSQKEDTNPTPRRKKRSKRSMG